MVDALRAGAAAGEWREAPADREGRSGSCRKGAGHRGLKSKMWLDYQNDVKVSDVQLAAREGYECVEHTKRYTTLGMATDQGKLSNINGLAVLADALNARFRRWGRRPSGRPIPRWCWARWLARAGARFSSRCAGTPMHGWHVANGAYIEPVGLWRRPYCFPRAGENHNQAVEREILNTRAMSGCWMPPRLARSLSKAPMRGGSWTCCIPGSCDLAHRQVPLWVDVQRNRGSCRTTALWPG